MLIVVADDLGAGGEVDAAIAEGMRQGLLSNTSLLANGPSFWEACELARREGWADRVGIHLSVTEGEALSAPIRRCPRFCDEAGMLRFRRFTHLALTAAERAALASEWQAQIDRCRAAGFALSHADSHHHSHAELPLLAVLVPLLKANGLPFLRLTDNVRKSGLPRRIYKRLVNARIARAGLRGVDYFCDAAQIGEIAGAADRLIEMMVHPAFDLQGDLIDATTGRALRSCVPADLRLGSFAALRAARHAGK